MANNGGSSGDVVIKLRLDTAQAEADLKRFQSGIGAATVVTGRMTGGGVPGYGPGGGGGSGGGGGGLDIGGMLMTAAKYAPVMAAGGMDVLRGVGSAVSGLGSAASESLGLADFRRRMDVPNDAAQRTREIFGIAGAFATPEQHRAVYEFEKRLGDMRADGASAVMDSISPQLAKDISDRLVEAMRDLTSAIGRAATGAASNIGSAFK